MTVVMTFKDTLIRKAIKDLDRAASAKAPSLTYELAHLAALGAAGAIVTARITPAQANTVLRPKSVWEALERVVPELDEWAAYFADGALLARKAHCGTAQVSPEDAEEMLSNARRFTDIAEGMV
jgi:hypothetical protein